jgi:mannose-1-phosphate guanylyltransferase
MSNVRQAVVVVGGKGTRLWPLTLRRPKPILPVLDRPCLSYLIDSLAEGGIKEVILACGYRSEKMAKAIGDGSGKGISIEYSYEDRPMGTAGAIKLLEDRLDDTFVAANGDTFADIRLKDQIKEHRKKGAAWTISLTGVKDPREFGIVRLDGDGRILEFKEKPKTPEETFSNLANAGIYVMEKELIGHIPEGQVYDLSKQLTPDVMRKGYRLQGHMLRGMWMDVGRPRDLLRANITAARRLHGGTEWKGIEPHPTGPFYLGRGGSVTGSEISSSVVSKGSSIRDSKISGSLIMANCEISGATISGSVIGERCIIREGAKIINAVIADGTAVNGAGAQRRRTE